MPVDLCKDETIVHEVVQAQVTRLHGLRVHTLTNVHALAKAPIYINPLLQLFSESVYRNVSTQEIGCSKAKTLRTSGANLFW